MRYEELDVNATYFVLLGWGNSTHWCECKFDDDIKVTDPTNVNMKVEF